MKMLSLINFISDGEVILTMEQVDPGRVEPGETSRQYLFYLRSRNGLYMGKLDPELTKGYGYNRAIAYVGSALLKPFPTLHVELRHIKSSGGMVSRWATSSLKAAIRQEWLDES